MSERKRYFLYNFDFIVKGNYLQGQGVCITNGAYLNKEYIVNNIAEQSNHPNEDVKNVRVVGITELPELDYEDWNRTEEHSDSQE